MVFWIISLLWAHANIICGYVPQLSTKNTTDSSRSDGCTRVMALRRRCQKETKEVDPTQPGSRNSSSFQGCCAMLRPIMYLMLSWWQLGLAWSWASRVWLCLCRAHQNAWSGKTWLPAIGSEDANADTPRLAPCESWPWWSFCRADRLSSNGGLLV
jgi:hypothetical protein